VHNALRLCSYPDFDGSVARGVIVKAWEVANRFDICLFAYCLPERLIADNTRDLYTDLKSLMSPERREMLEEYGPKIEALLKSKENEVFFSSRLRAEDSLVLEMITERQRRSRDELWVNPLQTFVAYFLYELAQDPERTKFAREFANAGQKATEIKWAKRRAFTLSRFVTVDVPPKGHKTDEKPAKRQELREKRVEFSLASIFRPPQDFVRETKNLRL
jgi:hypothetical protein